MQHRNAPLTYEQFRYAFANAVSEDEAKELYNEFAVPAAGAPLFQAATANLNPWTEAKVKSKNPGRGPLLILQPRPRADDRQRLARGLRRGAGVRQALRLTPTGHLSYQLFEARPRLTLPIKVAIL